MYKKTKFLLQKIKSLKKINKILKIPLDKGLCYVIMQKNRGEKMVEKLRMTAEKEKYKYFTVPDVINFMDNTLNVHLLGMVKVVRLILNLANFLTM